MKLTPYLLIAGAFIGIGDTLFLSYYQFMNLIPSCAVGGCEIVLTHELSKFFGIPFSYIGLVYYLHMLGVAILLAIDPHSKGMRLGALLYTGIGLGLSIVFELLQFFVIGAMCLYCGISAVTTLFLFVVALWHFVTTRVPQVDYQQTLTR